MWTAFGRFSESTSFLKSLSWSPLCANISQSCTGKTGSTPWGRKTKLSVLRCSYRKHQTAHIQKCMCRRFQENNRNSIRSSTLYCLKVHLALALNHSCPLILGRNVFVIYCNFMPYCNIYTWRTNTCDLLRYLQRIGSICILGMISSCVSDARFRNILLEYTQIYIIVLILDVADDRLYVFKNEINGSF